jgi:hypothetical protein
MNYRPSKEQKERYAAEKRRRYRELPEVRAELRAKTRAWAKANPDRVRERDWRRKGIHLTVRRYEAMLEEQDHRCAIETCRKHESEQDRSLAVDHDHKTGRVRGLLCNDCNRAIGLLGDSPDALRSAAEYLEGEGAQ